MRGPVAGTDPCASNGTALGAIVDEQAVTQPIERSSWAFIHTYRTCVRTVHQCDFYTATF